MDPIEIGEEFVSNQENNHCFGCSQSNAQGLRLRFVRTGEKSFESRCTVAEHHCGPPGVVQGGIQAAMLDEVMGVAAGYSEERASTVTAELALRYRRPVPTGEELRVTAELARREGDDYLVEGMITDESGERLTVGTGRFRWVDWMESSAG